MSIRIDFFSNIVDLIYANEHDDITADPSFSIYGNEGISLDIDERSLTSIEVSKVTSRQARITMLLNHNNSDWILNNIANFTESNIMYPHKPTPEEKELGFPEIDPKYLKIGIHIVGYAYVGVISISSISYDKKTKLLKFTAYDMLSLLELSSSSLNTIGGNPVVDSIEMIEKVIKDSINYSIDYFPYESDDEPNGESNNEPNDRSLDELKYMHNNSSIDTDIMVDMLKIYEWDSSMLGDKDEPYIDVYKILPSKLVTVSRVYYEITQSTYSSIVYYVTKLKYAYSMSYSGLSGFKLPRIDFSEDAYYEGEITDPETLLNYVKEDNGFFDGFNTMPDNSIFDLATGFTLGKKKPETEDGYVLYYTGEYHARYIRFYKSEDDDYWEYSNADILRALLSSINKILGVDRTFLTISNFFSVDSNTFTVPSEYIKSFKSIDYRFKTEKLDTDVLFDSSFLSKITNSVTSNIDFLKTYELVMVHLDYPLGRTILIDDVKYVVISKSRKKMEYTYKILKRKENE